MKEKRDMLRHFLAALAYRTQKALRPHHPVDEDAATRSGTQNVPVFEGTPQTALAGGELDGFASFDAGNGVRTPHELICHMRSVLGYARTFFIGGEYPRPAPADWHADIEAFHAMLEDLGQRLAAGDALNGITEEQLLQGPFADAMTHAGQLAMLRRLYGEPVPAENFIFADVSPENLTSDQSEPARPDAGWTPKHK